MDQLELRVYGAGIRPLLVQLGYLRQSADGATGESDAANQSKSFATAGAELGLFSVVVLDCFSLIFCRSVSLASKGHLPKPEGLSDSWADFAVLLQFFECEACGTRWRMAANMPISHIYIYIPFRSFLRD